VTSSTRREKSSSSRRAKPSIASVAVKTADLEKKIEELTQVLQRVQSSKGGTWSVPRAASEGSSTHINPSDSNSSQPPSTPTIPFSTAPSENASYSFFLGSPESRRSPSSELFPNGKDAYSDETEIELEQCLETYRSKVIPVLPIVLVGTDETIQSMANKHPFLWLVVRAITTTNLPRQVKLGRDIQIAIAQEMILGCNKTLDLLQGMLVFCGWCHHWIFRKPFTSLVVHLGMSLVSDLALNRPVPPEHEDNVFNISSAGCPKPPHLLRRGPRTLEERRALLAMHYITSMCVIFIHLERVSLIKHFY
jgi:hypothetical protein